MGERGREAEGRDCMGGGRRLPFYWGGVIVCVGSSSVRGQSERACGCGRGREQVGQWVGAGQCR